MADRALFEKTHANQYEQSFMHLVSSDLPSYLTELRVSMQRPISMSEFAKKGVDVSTLCRSFGLEGDFPGCYVLMQKGTPVYVGISRSVLRRLRQHVRGTTHFDASPCLANCGGARASRNDSSPSDGI